MNRTILINSAIWAVVILIISYFFKESENFKYAFATLIVGFSISNGIIYNKFKSNKKS